MTGDHPLADAHAPALSGQDAARLLGDAVSAVFRAIFARLWILGPLGLVLYLRLNRMRRSLEALFAAMAAIGAAQVPAAVAPAPPQCPPSPASPAGPSQYRPVRGHRRRLAGVTRGETCLAECDADAFACVPQNGAGVGAWAMREVAPFADTRPAGSCIGSKWEPFFKLSLGRRTSLRLNCSDKIMNWGSGHIDHVLAVCYDARAVKERASP